MNKKLAFLGEKGNRKNQKCSDKFSPIGKLFASKMFLRVLLPTEEFSPSQPHFLFRP